MPSPPQSFLDDVTRASRQPARLSLLALESESYPWHPEARTLIALGLADAPILKTHAHSLLFTGHMIDAPNRPHPRFPATAEPAAHTAILKALEGFDPATTIAIAGGASGGDLLFHESCHQLGIETLLRLTLPQPGFLAASVAPAGPAWVARFTALVDRLGPDRIQVLGDSRTLPPWLAGRKDYDVWQRTNLWLVEEARLRAPQRTLIALWDGQPGDGPGGTQHLVEAAPQYGIATTIIPLSAISD